MLKRFDAFKNYIAQQLESKLSHNLFYHGFHHTLEVVANATEIAEHERISPNENILLQTAVWLHDAGFIHTYTKHEEKGCEMAQEILPQYGYSKNDINIICGLIQATQIPQKPTTQLQNIIADADLMYLGTANYEPIAETLYRELTHYTSLNSHETWQQIQITFLENHQYHTPYCQSNYEHRKQQNLMHLKKNLSV
jgi:HD superfamily phosphodiesterase